MREEVFGRLNAATSELAEIAGSWPTGAVVDRCIEIFRTPPSEVMENSGLLSPFKQCFFLLAMMASTPEPRVEVGADVSESQWSRATELLIEIYGLYDTLFFPATREELRNRSRQDHDEIAVALGAFLHQHNTGILATPEQLLRRTREVMGPFDDALRNELGVSASVVCGIIEWTFATVQEELDWYMNSMLILRQLFDEATREGLDENAMRDRIGTDPRAVALREVVRRRPGHPHAITRAEVSERFGEAAALSFWNLFVTDRGSVTLPLYIDQPNPVEWAPLIALDGDTAVVVNPNTLATAAWLKLSNHLAKSKLGERFAKRRGKVHETEVASVAARYFGTDVRMFRSVYERPDAHGEHDLVVLLGRSVLVIEAKSTPLKRVFRDPKTAVRRLRHQFNAEEGIQSGCDQAARIRRRLIDGGEDVALYSRKGDLLHTLRPAEVGEIFCICVVADDFGVLATDLTIFLDKPIDEPYPWVVNAQDLESFLEALTRKSWEWPRFLEYLRERSQLQGKIRTTDELEVAGVFVTQGSLRDLIAADADTIQLLSDTARVFDEIFMEKQGGPPARLEAPGPLVMSDLGKELGLGGRKAAPPGASNTSVQFSADGVAIQAKAGMSLPPQRAGRNEACPCGSGKKFKKCHGRLP